MKKKLFYRVVPHNGGVVFATPDRAIFVAKIHAAIRSSKTWGQFRSAIPRKEYSVIIHSAFDDQGTARAQHTFGIPPQDVREAADGAFWMVQAGAIAAFRALPHATVTPAPLAEPTSDAVEEFEVAEVTP